MFSARQVFPDQPSSNMDYHALLHTQIYDYFLSSGMYSCGQALLNSDYNLRHQVMQAAAQRCTTEPRIATPSVLDSGFGSSYSSPHEEPYPAKPDDLSRAETEPALLYQWFCAFWDTLNSTQAQATGIPVQDCLSYLSDPLQQPPSSEPMICPDPFSLESLVTSYTAKRYSIDNVEKKKRK
ncbi:SOM1 [Fusarium sp. NRRL 52700]|nr:SOM1 [Fusarium sp. NRRL 52700]